MVCYGISGVVNWKWYRVKLSYSKFKAKKNLTVTSLRDGKCESMELQFRCS